MSDEFKLHDYVVWKNVNKGKDFSLYEYLHGVIETQNVKPDIILALVKLVWPDFIEIDGYIFLKENFTEKKYNDLVKADEEVEYWINLVNVDGIFSNMSAEQSLFIGGVIVDCWKHKLKSCFPDCSFTVECVYDESQSEVCVVFYKK